MPGLKKHFPDVRFSGNYVSPDEIDRYEQYQVIFPTTSITWFGTSAAGTAGQAKAYVVINKTADFPRNIAAAVEGTSDMGGVWVLNGKDQFGNSITETLTVSTVANGGTTSGTKVFAEVTSGTCTIDSGALGNGTPKVGGDISTGHLWGLPTKIGSTADVKAITWAQEQVTTTINGGTVGAYVGTAFHTFSGTEVVGGTEVFTCLFRPTYNAEYANSRMANL